MTSKDIRAKTQNFYISSNPNLEREIFNIVKILLIEQSISVIKSARASNDIHSPTFKNDIISDLESLDFEE